MASAKSLAIIDRGSVTLSICSDLLRLSLREAIGPMYISSSFEVFVEVIVVREDELPPKVPRSQSSSPKCLSTWESVPTKKEL
jgi:hypothetical protein